MSDIHYYKKHYKFRDAYDDLSDCAERWDEIPDNKMPKSLKKESNELQPSIKNNKK